jgi:hypothetical protein
MNMEYADLRLLLEIHQEKSRKYEAEAQHEHQANQSRIQARLLRQSLTLEYTPVRLQFEQA